MVLESSPDRQHVYARSPDLHERSPEPFSLPANLARSKHGSRSSPSLVVLQNHENNNRTKNSSNNNYNQIQNNPNKTPKNDFPKPDYSPVQIRKNGHYIKKVKFKKIKFKNVFFCFVCFSNPTCPPQSSIGSVQCVSFYTLSSLAFKGVTSGMS